MINFFKEFYSNLASKSEPTKTEEFVKVEKSDGGFKHPLLLVSSETLQDVSLLILAMVLIVASLALKNHLINWVNVAISKTFGLQTISNEEYEKQKEEHTNQQLSQLRDSQKYKFLLNLRGTDESNQNWQSRERAAILKKQQYEEFTASNQGRRQSVQDISQNYIYDSSRLEDENNDESEGLMEREFIEMDRQLEIEGGLQLDNSQGSIKLILDDDVDMTQQ